MSFSGKSTFAAGTDLPELAEDVADIVSIVSPHETPFLAHIGDSGRPAYSTIHEWIEDTLLPNTDSINQVTFTPNPTDATSITVANGPRFTVGDQVRPANASESMFVTAVAGNVITVVRRYGGTTGLALANAMRLTILGNAALEGADASQAKFTNRTRRVNYTQIFAATAEVTGTMSAVRGHGVRDELEFQKAQRLRELIRDLENSVINGSAPAASPQGSTSVRRTMNGVIKSIVTNQFVPSLNGFPAGGGGSSLDLTETLVNAAIRNVWEQSAARIDTILVNASQKRRFNQFVASTAHNYTPHSRNLSEIVSVYESDFGVARILLSRWVPADTVLFLDSSRLAVMPLAGRSFSFKPLAATGDATAGQILGEYTLEMKNESAHSLIRGLSTT